MGKMTTLAPLDLLKELRADNAHMSAIALEVFANALRIYLEASDNVRTHGAVVAHPRTGAPMDNPYLKIQTAQGATLAKMTRVKSDRVLALATAADRAPTG